MTPLSSHPHMRAYIGRIDDFFRGGRRGGEAILEIAASAYVYGHAMMLPALDGSCRSRTGFNK